MIAVENVTSERGPSREKTTKLTISFNGKCSNLPHTLGIGGI
jgi:hypothetical protein